ncbi:MAG: thioredoxin fold domain-containing protein [Bacteroidetes bacterium]|nr:thioredoxin fold domain-containing protein [Bacteroidota bacterium]MBS1975592.1 thioredoxin fold domain-containing protein [Bacteroidota bacterium]
MKYSMPAILCTALLVSCQSNAQNTNLSVEEFQKAIAQKNIQLLDVRTREEYLSGHIKNTFWADWNDRTEFQSRAEALDKKKPIYIYCLSGARSNAAAQWLRKQGYTAYNLNGGINAWERAGKPIEGFRATKQISMQEYLSQIPGNKTVLVDFGAEWCPPCKLMAPIVDSLKSHGSLPFVLVKIDGGAQVEICKKLGVDAFPTFIVYKNGKETWRKQGIIEAKEMVSHL